jgi:hypothetical protein
MWIALLGFFCVCFVISVFVSDRPFIDAIRLMLFLFGVGFIIFSFWLLKVLYFDNLNNNNTKEPEVMQYEDNGSSANNQCYDYALKQMEKDYDKDDAVVISDGTITNSKDYLECMGQ